MATSKKTPAKRPGRPALEEGTPTVGVQIRMTVPQRAKLIALGGAKWVREQLDKARMPK